MITEHRTCAGCQLNQKGKCHDWTLFGPEGDDLPTDSGVRLCYEARAPALDPIEQFLDAICKEREP